jgi:hypothetical protein
VTGEAPFRWTQPATWPWVIWLWLLLLIAGWLKSTWKWWQRYRIAEWPTTAGRIQTARIADPTKVLGMVVSSRRTEFPVEISYTYQVGGADYSGHYKKVFAAEAEAREFLRDLEGKAIEVRYAPSNANRSGVTDAAMNSALESRAPAPPADVASPIPEWAMPLIWPVILLCVAGFCISLWVHISAIMGRRVTSQGMFFALHAGAIVLCFPSVFVAQKLVGNTNRKDFWKAVLRDTPGWVRYVVYACLGYAALNFMYGWLQMPAGKNANDSPVEWRMFSGHWMAFYATSGTILYSATRQKSNFDRCINGHLVAAASNFCPRCGQAVIRRANQQ